MSVRIRRLEKADFDRGFLTLLAQLTTVGDISRSAFEQRFDEMARLADTYNVFVAYDPEAPSRLLGTAAVVVERKFLRGLGKCGHFEDVVVDKAARGRAVGKKLIAVLMNVAREAGCYKVILDCSEDNVPFYERCDMRRKEVQMVHYFTNVSRL